MEVIKYAVGIQILVTVICLGIIIVLIIKRIKTRSKEDFEKRDN